MFRYHQNKSRKIPELSPVSLACMEDFIKLSEHELSVNPLKFGGDPNHFL